MTLLSKVVTILLNFLINDMEHLAKYKAQSFIRNNTLQFQSSLCFQSSSPDPLQSHSRQHSRYSQGSSNKATLILDAGWNNTDLVC